MSKRLYKYHQNQNIKTTFDITEITPVYWNKLYAGEKLKNLSYQNLTRMITPIWPTLDNAYIDLFAFAVPRRIMQKENATTNPKYNHIVTEMQSKIFDLCKSPLTPTQVANLAKAGYPLQTFTAESNLLNKFAINPVDGFNITSDSATLDLSYLLAYKKIYYDFFRNKQLEQTDYNKLYNDLTNNGIYKSIDIPKITDVGKTTAPGAFEKTANAFYQLTQINVTNTDNDFLNGLTYSQVNTDMTFTGLTQFNLFREQLFKNFMQNAQIMEQIPYGTQKDILLKVWHTDNYDKTNARLIGYDRFDQRIKQVINQAQVTPKDSATSNAAPLGEVGGMSVNYNDGMLVNEYTATEETYIIVVAVPNYKLVIRNLTQPQEMVFIGAEQQFNPNMQYIQEPLHYSSFLGVNSQSDKVLAFHRPYNYLRYKNDVVAGQIATLWNNWTYSIEFDPIKGIDLGLLKANKKPFKETLVSAEQDAFISEFAFTGDYYRVIKPDYEIVDEILEGE